MQRPKLRQRLPGPLPKTSEEMKAWSLALPNDLSSWPEVAGRPIFGMMAFYRGNRI